MGFVKLVTPAILGIAKRNKTAGKLAFNTLAGGIGVSKKIGKALPVIGAGITAVDAYGNYQSAAAAGEDPGQAALEGIGATLGAFGGGIAGTALGGPVGGIAGYLGGGEAGRRLGRKGWDAATSQYNQPASAIPTIEEFRQRQMQRQQRLKQSQAGNFPGGGMMNIGGFQYSKEADPTLVALRLQQQGQNIDKVQGYSRDKFGIAAQLRSQLGQQYTDRYGIGQMNQTDRLGIMQSNLTQRYGIGQQAGVENRRTLRDERLGLGQQYTDRYAIGRNASRDETLGLGQQYTQRYGIARQSDVENRRTDSNTRLGLGQQYTDRFGMSLKAGNERYGLDTQRQLGFGELGLRDRERKDKNRQFDVNADIQRQQVNNNFGLGAMSTLAGLYR